MSEYTFDWSDLAFESKKKVRQLDAVFVAAPREVSAAWFTKLLKTYLPQGNLILGLAKEKFIDGFEGQPQFRTLQELHVADLIARVNTSASKHKVYTLSYFQRETPYIIEKLKPKRALFINGSWHKSFHMLPTYYALINNSVPYRLISPFVDEAEALEYERKIEPELVVLPKKNSLHSRVQMLEVAAISATHSYDHTFQTGASLGKASGNTYKLLATSFNKIVPYSTYAMHNGALREKNFSPANDLNHYDTVHAEVALLVHAQKQKIDLVGTTMFINLMPCPTCARMLVETDISYFVYQHDHSDGYAIKLFAEAGKQVERVVL